MLSIHIFKANSVRPLNFYPSYPTQTTFHHLNKKIKTLMKINKKNLNYSKSLIFNVFKTK